MQNLKVTLVQTSLLWEDAAGNLESMAGILEGVTEETHLVVLPEMFTSGFTMNAEANAQTMDGPAVAWMRQAALDRKVHITGSMIIREGDRFFNRLVWVSDAGEIHTYDKKHLFRYAGEQAVYTPGETLMTVDVNGWKVRPFICYDLRFPVWLRNLNKRYDVAVFVANWPARRSLHWKTLLAARAIENQAYVIGVNRVGTDGNLLDYTGDSMAVSPLGDLLFHSSEATAATTVELSREILDTYRDTFPAWMDSDTNLIAQPL